MSVLDAPAGDVAAYAVDVRRALTGLTPEQVEDLTDDLEQALADAMADDHRSGAGVGLVGLFGTPSEYAAELRAAAGLEERSGAHRRSTKAFRSAIGDAVNGVLEPLQAQPWWPSLAGFFRALAPIWWVLRGWLLFMVAAAFLAGYGDRGQLPRSLFGWAVLLTLVVLSVQWGRGRWRRRRAVRVVAGCLTAVSLVYLIPMLQELERSLSVDPSISVYQPVAISDGIYVAGEPVSNLFVYDADGAPVVGAQVFDGQGRPVTTSTDASGYWYDERDGSTSQLVPATAADGGQRWNVFPLRGQQPSDIDPDVLGPVVDPTWPFAQATAVLTPRPAATDDTATSSTGPAAPDASAKPDPNASAKPDPDASAKPGPTPSADG